MAPEAPGNLIVIDLYWEDTELKGTVDRLDYHPDETEQIELSGGWIYVLWNETPTGKNYRALGNNTVYVEEPFPRGYRLTCGNQTDPTPLTDSRFAYTYPALGEGLMFVLILPRTDSLDIARCRPTPKSAKRCEDGRLAVYWKPQEKYGNSAEIIWQIRSFHGDVTEERNRLNAEIRTSANVPDNSGVLVDDIERNEEQWRRSTTAELKRKMLAERLDLLFEQFEAMSRQLNMSTDEAVKVVLRNKLKRIEQEMIEVEHALRAE
jgi:hypothetical protein